jgi:hypothetical protein
MNAIYFYRKFFKIDLAFYIYFSLVNYVYGKHNFKNKILYCYQILKQLTTES